MYTYFSPEQSCSFTRRIKYGFGACFHNWWLGSQKLRLFQSMQPIRCKLTHCGCIPPVKRSICVSFVIRLNKLLKNNRVAGDTRRHKAHMKRFNFEDGANYNIPFRLSICPTYVVRPYTYMVNFVQNISKEINDTFKKKWVNYLFD